MNLRNKYYRIAVYGFVLSLLLQLVLFFAVDPYIASVISPFYPVWFILFVVGWRQEHPRR
ncbi:hypothetical protein [Pontibacter flavimaris]|jgi:drug/metabolite transporter (DMT)-like permease|uniref:DUF5668 domain-containing protein n=1 Tax=Pontibacter flavimaris TaxID=1797110 RepID=A0A1Q5PFF0_9BACT|nr:hypothetical protein [Pontibacter flavimaris]OKL40891.1 hypothetical protein A3841_13685 [Pontibacter flavimaris]